jgi:hypothetical protein
MSLSLTAILPLVAAGEPGTSLRTKMLGEDPCVCVVCFVNVHICTYTYRSRKRAHNTYLIDALEHQTDARASAGGGGARASSRHGGGGGGGTSATSRGVHSGVGPIVSS